MSHSLPQRYDSLASILIPLKGVDIIPKGQNSFFSRLRPLSKLVTLLLSTKEKENGLLVSLSERKKTIKIKPHLGTNLKRPSRAISVIWLFVLVKLKKIKFFSGTV